LVKREPHTGLARPCERIGDLAVLLLAQHVLHWHLLLPHLSSLLVWPYHHEGRGSHGCSRTAATTATTATATATNHEEGRE